jgi:hypothetical protein
MALISFVICKMQNNSENYFLFTVAVINYFTIDHYGGLSARFNAGPIYCSEVTRDLVLTKFKINPDIIVSRKTNCFNKFK